MKRLFAIIFLLSFVSGTLPAQDVSGNTSKLSNILSFLSGDRKKSAVTTTLRDGSVYVGEVKRKRPHGNGSVLYTNGDKYNGGFVNGMREGTGVYEYKNGDRYEGGYNEDEKHGTGVFVFADGRKYDGRVYITVAKPKIFVAGIKLGNIITIKITIIVIHYCQYII